MQPEEVAAAVALLKRWTILAGIPKVVEDEESNRIFMPGADISVAYNELPAASVLTVPLRISSPPSPNFYPYIAAVDGSGLLLLCARHHPTPSSSTFTYHLCDARTGEVISLCPHWGPKGLHGVNVGLIMRNDRCMVAELQPNGDGTGRATLLCYTVGHFRWVEMELAYSPPLRGRYWHGDGVVSLGDMLWWVDLSYGILACDPFAYEPELLHVPLPRVAGELPATPANRCVKVSGGRLRYVQIHGDPDAPVVSTWALADTAPAREWIPECSVCLAAVWADESYLYTMLPRSIPALALLHPTDPDKVYFFLGSSIFAIDLRLRKVVQFSEFRMPDLPGHMMTTSHFVHAWHYHPSSLRSSASIPTRFRKKMETAAMKSFLVVMCGTRKTARKSKRFRNFVSRKPHQAVRMMKPTHIFKGGRGTFEEDLKRLASLTLNEGGRVP